MSLETRTESGTLEEEPACIPEPVWKVSKKRKSLKPAGIQNPDNPACS